MTECLELRFSKALTCLSPPYVLFIKSSCPSVLSVGEYNVPREVLGQEGSNEVRKGEKKV